jgi:hypothetical protein
VCRLVSTGVAVQVSHLLLPGAPDLLDVLVRQLDGPSVRHRLQDLRRRRLGVQAEEGQPAVLFLDQHDSDQAARRPPRRQERLDGLGHPFAVLHAFDLLPAARLPRPLRQADATLAVDPRPAALSGTVVMLPRLVATFTALKSALAGVRIAVMALNAAVLSNPYLLLGAAVIALVAMFVDWKALLKDTAGLMAGFGNVATGVFKDLASVLKPVVDAVRDLSKAFKDLTGIDLGRMGAPALLSDLLDKLVKLRKESDPLRAGRRQCPPTGALFRGRVG